jgi:predicted PurR-regulated permease PerM
MTGEQPGITHDPERAETTPWLTPGHLLSLIAVLAGAWATVVIVRALRELLIMLLVALFLSFAMEPAVQFLARRGWRRGAATGVVFLVVILASVGIVWTIVPFLVDQTVRLVQAVPTSIEELNRIIQNLPYVPDFDTNPEWQREIAAIAEDFGERARDVALGAAGNVFAIGATALGLLARTLAVLLLTFYLVSDGPRFRRTLAGPFPPDHQREMLAIWELAVAKTGGYIYSRLLIGALSSVVHGIALAILGVPNALALALWMGLLTALIPLVGVPLGGLLLMVAAFIHDPMTALWLFIVIMAYQQLENYVLGPKIQAHVMDLHPAVAFVSVIVGATLLGVVGALLALPAAAITKALLSTYVRRHELIEELHDISILGIDDEDLDRETPASEDAPQPASAGGDRRATP